MSGWPKVKCSVKTRFFAYHSLPGIGVAEKHPHEYAVSAGWTSEINPHHGCTKPMDEMRQDLDKLVDGLDRRYLNDIFAPYPPTAETLACWLMARLPSYWDHVVVECYNGYRVEVQANSLRAEWAEKYRA